MTFNLFMTRVGICMLIPFLHGCPGTGENTSEEGITLHLAETHSEVRPGGTELGESGISNGVGMTGGYDQDNIEHHTIRDVNGRMLSIYRAYLVLDNVELVQCPSITQLPDQILNMFIGKAHAHSGHGSEPVGDRNLDEPNVIDIITQDEFVLPLGDVSLAPGRYCSMRVGLVRLAGAGYGIPTPAAASTDDPTTLPDIPDLNGRMFALRADYCATTDLAGQCSQRVKVDIDDTNLIEPTAVTLDFPTPLELNATLREGYVSLGIAYGEWMSDVDITLLASDTIEQQKLLANIIASLHIYAYGWGELPANL